MKNVLFKAVSSLFIVLLLSSFVGAMFDTVSPGNGVFGFCATFLLFSIPLKGFANGPVALAIQNEIWVNYIIENLFKNNEFMEKAKNADQYVVGGRVVHIPQAGATPTVVVDPTSYPLAVKQRIDTDIAYVLRNYITLPMHITNAEMQEISYDKIASVIGEHVKTLGDAIADHLIVQWLETSTFTGAGTIPAATVIRSTGANVAAHLGTGNRKKLTKEDLQAARKTLNKQNIPARDRYALLSSDMLDQLANDDDLKKRDSALELDMRSGTIGRLYGFELMERSEVASFTNDATPVVKAIGAADATTDNDAVICWQMDQVERARGTVKFFEKLDDPQYVGDIYNASVRMGGRKCRQDGKGIIAIVQDAGA